MMFPTKEAVINGIPEYLSNEFIGMHLIDGDMYLSLTTV